MERLTERDDKGNLLFSGKQVYAGDFYEAASCLEEYEDTGLDPYQIRELKERDTGVKPVSSDGWDMCGNCGEHLMPSDSFCSECGSRIKWED